MRGIILKLLAKLVLACIFLVVLGGGYYQYATHIPLQLSDDVFLVKRGETLSSLVNRLMDEGAVKEPYTLKLFARVNGLDKQIQAGEYRLTQDITIPQFLDQLTSGEGQVEIKIAIIEGWSFKQMRAALANAEKLEKITTDWTDEEVMEKLGYPDLHPEGQFYPDTYYYQSGDSDLSILETAFNLMQRKLDQVWESRQSGIMIETKYEALILASIIEKETQHRPEQGRISGVFNNRLKKGMKLQTDPTVIYGLGDSYNGNITRKHLRTDTPYNTYTRYGLTPTPISLPGMGSLVAAVNPEKTDAYYFVAKGGGQHHFSRTLREHNNAVNKYILNK